MVNDLRMLRLAEAQHKQPSATILTVGRRNRVPKTAGGLRWVQTAQGPFCWPATVGAKTCGSRELKTTIQAIFESVISYDHCATLVSITGLKRFKHLCQCVL